MRYFVTDRGVAGVSAADFQARRRPRVRDMAGRADRVDHLSVRRLHRGAARATTTARSTLGFRERARARSRAGVDQLSHRRCHRRAARSPTSSSTARSRGRSRAGRRARPLRSRDDRAARDRPPERPRAIRRSARPSSATAGRRVLAAGAVMFPIAFGAGNIVRPHAAGRRHRRHLRPLSRRRLQRRTPAASPDASRRTARACSARTSWPSIPRPARWSATSRSTPQGQFSIAGLRAGPVRRPRRAAGRRGHRRVSSIRAGCRPRFRVGVLRAAGRRAARAATAARSRSR